MVCTSHPKMGCPKPFRKEQVFWEPLLQGLVETAQVHGVRGNVARWAKQQSGSRAPLSRTSVIGRLS
jgi:hypothetical protein